ncbi:hypothetical protein T265_00454 [Opisthorchis viverrini]|uniref:Uncharacterized protein n=1 Tax=Opisthorchis viverrini TaxID=6198 RepID=A0A075A247_OPIVI|nr:hypothetical protein T265_00454 [Opisthorchis viverrini]KER33783.1 hypothetical protein T265_00454 [Opisthorchis viverrini]
MKLGFDPIQSCSSTLHFASVKRIPNREAELFRSFNIVCIATGSDPKRAMSSAYSISVSERPGSTSTPQALEGGEGRECQRVPSHGIRTWGPNQSSIQKLDKKTATKLAAINNLKDQKIETSVRKTVDTMWMFFITVQSTAEVAGDDWLDMTENRRVERPQAIVASCYCLDPLSGGDSVSVRQQSCPDTQTVLAY